MTQTTYRIPKEHGAYVVLLASWLMGVLAAPRADWTSFALVLSTSLSVFLLQDPFKQFVRPKRTTNPFANASAVSLALIGATSGIALVASTPQVAICVPPLSIIGVVYYAMLRSRRSAIARSFVGFSGLTLVAPLSVIAAVGAEDLERAVVVWIFSTLFFCTSIYCVAIRLREPRAVRNAILYHVVTLAVAAAMIGGNLIALPAFIAMAIPAVRLSLIVPYRMRYASLAIKYIGIHESIVALLALVVLAVWR